MPASSVNSTSSSVTSHSSTPPRSPTPTYSKSTFSIKQARETEQKLKNELIQLDQELHEMSDQDLFNTMIESIQQYKMSIQQKNGTGGISNSGDSQHSVTESPPEKESNDDSEHLQQYVDIIEVLREKLELTMQELAHEREKVKQLAQSGQEQIAKGIKEARETELALQKHAPLNNGSSENSHQDNESQERLLQEMREEMDDIRAENETLHVTIKLLQNHNEMLKQQFLNEKRNSKLIAQHCKKLESLIAFQKEEVHNFIVSHRADGGMGSPRVVGAEQSSVTSTTRRSSAATHHSSTVDAVRRRSGSGSIVREILMDQLSPIPHRQDDESYSVPHRPLRSPRGTKRPTKSMRLSQKTPTRSPRRRKSLGEHLTEHFAKKIDPAGNAVKRRDMPKSPRRLSGAQSSR